MQGSRKETTALRKLTLMEGANFPRTRMRLIITLRQLLTSSFVIDAAYSFISYIVRYYVFLVSEQLLKLFNINNINFKHYRKSTCPQLSAKRKKRKNNSFSLTDFFLYIYLDSEYQFPQANVGK